MLATLLPANHIKHLTQQTRLVAMVSCSTHHVALTRRGQKPDRCPEEPMSCSVQNAEQNLTGLDLETEIVTRSSRASTGQKVGEM